VQFEAETDSGKVIIPAGAEAISRPGKGPGTPYSLDAPAQRHGKRHGNGVSDLEMVSAEGIEPSTY